MTMEISRFTFAALLAAAFLTGCKSEPVVPQPPPIETAVADSMLSGPFFPHPKDSAREAAQAMVVHDSLGIGAFTDSLRRDVNRGSLAFLLEHLSDDFSGNPRFEKSGNGSFPMKDDPKFAKETALFLAWMLEPRRLGKVPEAVDGTAVLSPGDSTNPCDPDRYHDEQNYCVYLPQIPVPLFDSIGGTRIGSVADRWVYGIQTMGGRKLKHFPQPIRPEWMKIRTRAGLVGWTPGGELEDILGATIAVNLVHLDRGWRVSGMFTNDYGGRGSIVDGEQ